MTVQSRGPLAIPLRAQGGIDARADSGDECGQGSVVPLTSTGTLYLLATGAGAGASWALVAAFIEDLVETARHLSSGSPGARLDSPLLLALDEIGNLAPLPSLPMLMAEGGGTGITTMPILQSRGPLCPCAVRSLEWTIRNSHRRAALASPSRRHRQEPVPLMPNMLGARQRRATGLILDAAPATEIRRGAPPSVVG